jgi:aminocarboxymuconate-semialdehyde decarboxylase
MPLIDFHNHYYPPKYLQALQSGSSRVTVTIDEEGNPVLHYPGDYNIAVRGHRDLAYRAEVLAQHGVATQVISLTTPGTHVEDAAEAVRLASLVNDEFREAMDRYPGIYVALATLPLNDPEASVLELQRAMQHLRMPGAMLFSNVNGVPLSDRRFWPLYDAANDAGAVLYIHPTNPVSVAMMQEYWLMPLVGFLFDTTLAAASLVFSGVVERFPRIHWVLTHMGGAIPYLAERLDRGFDAFKECRVNIAHRPSKYLREFYYDTVNFNPDAARLAIAFAGTEHIVAGSDYPHQIGSIPLMIETLDELRLPHKEHDAIRGGNAARLLGL